MGNLCVAVRPEDQVRVRRASEAGIKQPDEGPCAEDGVPCLEYTAHDKS